MTKDEIIRIAHQAGGYSSKRYTDEWRFDDDDLKQFAELVAAAEREECAKVCEEGLNILTSDSALEWMEIFGEKFAAAIRARGQQ